jgi:hypothetical protein
LQEIVMKTLTSLLTVVVLLGGGVAFAQPSTSGSAGQNMLTQNDVSNPDTSGQRAPPSARSSRNARENRITAELNREQLSSNAQQAEMPPPENAPMVAPSAVSGSKVVPQGASCGTDNPSCAQHLNNPAVNSPSQLRLYHAQ